jgi:hypothetical protein
MAAKRKEKLKLTSEERERLVEFSQNFWNLFDPRVPAPSLMHGLEVGEYVEALHS